jgi:hypothetical protein
VSGLLVGVLLCVLGLPQAVAVGQAASATPLASPPSPDPVTTPTPTPTATATPTASIASPFAVRAETAAGTLRSTGATWSTRTPQLVGPLDPTVLASIDAALATAVEGELAAFEARSEAPVDGLMGVDDLEMDFTVALLTPELLSLRLLTYTYASGAAHGGTVMRPWSFDLRTGERLSLDDLFADDAAYLPALARAARQRLLPALGFDRSSRAWVRDGTRPTQENYAGWALTDEGLQITFAQYQVAPYAEGMPVTVIPWPELAHLLDPVGPVSRLDPDTRRAADSSTPPEETHLQP